MAGGPEAGVVLRQQARRWAEVGRHATKSRTAWAAGRDAVPDGVGVAGVAGVVGDGRRGPVSGVQPYVLSLNQGLSGIAEPGRSSPTFDILAFWEHRT